MAKRIVLTLFLMLSISLQARSIHHMRVIWQEDPTTESYIGWTTKGPIPVFGNRVYYDTVSRNGKVKDYRFKKKPYLQKPYPYSVSMLHAVKLKNLTPDTTYYFVIKSGKDVSKEYHFRTAPKKNKAFSLFFGGDSRSDRPKRREINELMGKMFEENPDVLALVHGGDFVNNGAKWKEWKAWMEDHQLTTTPKGRVLPIIPTRGNHEISRVLFDNVFLHPGKLKRSNYFTTRIADLSLITLNTNIVLGGPQKKWLKKELDKAKKESTWIIPNYHRPAFPAVKRPGRALKHWVPMFEDYQVDLVFESDGHTLKRTAPVYRGKVNHDKGIIYVGEGGLGVKQREPKMHNEWYFQAPGYAVSKHHIMRLKVLPKRMQLDIHLDDGSRFDSIKFAKRNR